MGFLTNLHKHEQHKFTESYLFIYDYTFNFNTSMYEL